MSNWAFIFLYIYGIYNKTGCSIVVVCILGEDVASVQLWAARKLQSKIRQWADF